MLMVKAGFRSLTFRGMTWQKEANLLPATTSEPNGAEGVFMINRDLRKVESVNFIDCTFDNCHGAVAVYGKGFDARGKLANFRFYRSQVVNPFGSNTTNGERAYGGGQQVRLNPWVASALYYDNLFRGGSDNLEPVYNPSGRRKDGSHFGCPLNLIFTNNVVSNMGVEAVYQVDEPWVGVTSSGFTVPPADGSIVTVTLEDWPTTFVPGQLLLIRTFFNLTPGSPGVNIYVTVAAFDAANRVLSFTNPGISPGFEGRVVPAPQNIYLQSYNPTFATITGNALISATYGISDIGIASNAKATIANNFVHSYRRGIHLYPSTYNLLHPPTPGTVIDGNVILVWAGNSYQFGIESNGPGETISRNLVVAPAPYWFCGVCVDGTNTWIKENTVIARQIVRHDYGNLSRSVGIGIGNPSRSTTSISNRTYGMDVGIGPSTPHQSIPHRIIGHFSTNDTLAIDPRGVY